VILFLISDALLAWNRFRMKFQSTQFLILGTYYVAQWALAMSLGQPNVYYLSCSFITMQNLLKNYFVLLKNLREKNSLLFVMHVFFVGAALLTLLLVMLSSGLRLLV